MFKISENFEVDPGILQSVYIRYSPAKVSTKTLLLDKYITTNPQKMP